MIAIFRNSLPEVFSQRDVLKNYVNFTRKHLRRSPFFNKVGGCSLKKKKETPTQAFFCDFGEFFKKCLFCIRPLQATTQVMPCFRHVQKFVPHLFFVDLHLHLKTFNYVSGATSLSAIIGANIFVLFFPSPFLRFKRVFFQQILINEMIMRS